MADQLQEITQFLRAFDREAGREKRHRSKAVGMAHQALDILDSQKTPIDHPAKLAAVFRDQLARAVGMNSILLPLDRPHYKIDSIFAALMEAVKQVEDPNKDIRVSRNVVSGKPHVTISWLPEKIRQTDPRSPRWIVFEGDGVWTPRADGYPFVTAKVKLDDRGALVDLNTERVLFGARAGDLVAVKGGAKNLYYVEGASNRYLFVYNPNDGSHLVLDPGQAEATRIQQWGDYDPKKEVGFNPLVNFARFRELGKS